MSFDLTDFELASPVSVGCEHCESSARLTALLKTGETFCGIQRGKEIDTAAWTPTDTGWLCPDCHEHAPTTNAPVDLHGPPDTVPEPPDEWRFCQDCGAKISPARLEGQFCAECTDS